MKYRDLFTFGWLFFFTALVFLGNLVLPDVMIADSDRLVDLASNPNYVSQKDGHSSYLAAAAFFKYFPPPLDLVLILTVGWSYLLLYLYKLRLPTTFIIAYHMSFPAVISALIRPQKEIIVAMLAICVFLIVQKQGLNRLAKILLVALCYFVYAYIFRHYFFVILALFLCITIWTSSSLYLRVPMLAFAAVVMLFVPVEVFVELQGVRDDMNLPFVGTDIPGHRTAFLNPMPVDSLGNFLINYAYAFVWLNIPVIFDLSIKAWYWFSIVLCYLTMIIYGYRHADKNQKIFLNLFLAHMATLVMFEPDVGTYTRHITSVFIYMVPGLMAWENQRRKGRANA